MKAIHLVWLLPSVMLGAALLPLPYAYYGLLRVVVCIAMIFLVVRGIQTGQQVWPWLFGAFALLYNPITSVSLGRPLWSVVNFVTIGALAWHWWSTERAKPS